ncbi:hypothetical protein [Azospirillum argentinense]
MRNWGVAPHVARNTGNRRSAINGRTTRHPGLRKARHRGAVRVGWMFTLTATAYNLIRPPKLLAAA